MPELTELEAQAEILMEKITELRKQLVDVNRKLGERDVDDYKLLDSNGNPVMLSELFGDKNDLILVHNMGKKCPYCTLWADGFIGFTKHLNNRAAFVLVSPDESPVMKEFTEGRGWNFRCISGYGSSFIKDMGYETDDGKYMPGVSTFRKSEDGSMRRVAKDYFGPGDPYCSVWHFFDLLEDREYDWSPKYRY